MEEIAIKGKGHLNVVTFTHQSFITILRGKLHALIQFFKDSHSGEFEMVIFAGKSNGYHNDIWKYVLGT